MRLRNSRGRFIKKDARSVHVASVRFTDAEHAHVKAQAAAAGLSLSEYLRRRALGHVVVSRETLNLINELRRQGGLIKHSLAQLDGASRDEARAAFAAIQRAIERLGGESLS
jgi:hypothetical protein